MTKVVATRGILLAGAGGMLGRAWRAMLDAQCTPYTTASREQLDFLKPDTIDRFVDDRFDLIINCAAYTNVDGAETDSASAQMINGEAVARLAKRCAATGATLVHYSTDYVFNGQATTPYTIGQQREPLNAYGISKAMGEQAIEDARCRALVIRTSWLYAPWGGNFVRTIAKLAGQRPTLRVVNDQRGRPTSCEHLADASLRLLRAKASGIHHVADGGECTWFDFASEIVRLRGAACQVDPCTTAEFPRPAKRPAYSVLDLAVTERIIGTMPHWRDNLKHVMDHLEPL